MLFVDALVCRTQTVCPFVMVDDRLVNMLVQPMEYVPPKIAIGAALFIPLTTTVLDVMSD